jgi:enamine deaminase RidA (YjgF/YER057c/UK114 family)
MFLKAFGGGGWTRSFVFFSPNQLGRPVHAGQPTNVHGRALAKPRALASMRDIVMVARERCTMSEIKILNPDGLGKPLGQYSHITRVKASEFLFIAGQVATDNSGKPIGVNDFDAQCRQVFANIEAGLKSQGAGFANIVEFTTYLVHSQDIANFMSFRSREFPRMFPGGRYPPNTLLIVDRLVQEAFLIEVQTVAAL